MVLFAFLNVQFYAFLDVFNIIRIYEIRFWELTYGRFFRAVPFDLSSDIRILTHHQCPHANRCVRIHTKALRHTIVVYKHI